MSRSASLGCSLMRASSTKSMMSSKNGSSCLRISFRSCDSVLTGRLLGSNWVFGRIQFCHRWCPFFNLCGYALALMPDKYEIHTLPKLSIGLHTQVYYLAHLALHPAASARDIPCFKVWKIESVGVFREILALVFGFVGTCD